MSASLLNHWSLCKCRLYCSTCHRDEICAYVVNQTDLQRTRVSIAVGPYVVDRYVNEMKGTSPVPFLLHCVSSSKKCHARSSSDVAQTESKWVTYLSFHFVGNIFVLPNRKARPKVRKIHTIINSLCYASKSSDMSHFFCSVMLCNYLFWNPSFLYSIFYVNQYTKWNERTKVSRFYKAEIQRYNRTVVIACLWDHSQRKMPTVRVIDLGPSHIIYE